jgi:hypothetical protein
MLNSLHFHLISLYVITFFEDTLEIKCMPVGLEQLRFSKNKGRSLGDPRRNGVAKIESLEQDWNTAENRHLSDVLFKIQNYISSIPVAAQSKAWVCGRSLAGISGSNPTGGMDTCVL